MRCFVPFTEIQPATRIALRGYDYCAVPIDGPDGYRDYFETRWIEGQTFVNVEHDVVVWPGALEELDECGRPWCAFGYSAADHYDDPDRSPFPYLGCAKFSARLIAATTPLVWRDTDWRTLDRTLAAHVRSAGFDVHQHHPPVVNANPVLLGG